MRDNPFHVHVCFKLIQVCGVNDDARQAKHAGMIIKMNIRLDALSLSGFFGEEYTSSASGHCVSFRCTSISDSNALWRDDKWRMCMGLLNSTMGFLAGILKYETATPVIFNANKLNGKYEHWSDMKPKIYSSASRQFIIIIILANFSATDHFISTQQSHPDWSSR